MNNNKKELEELHLQAAELKSLKQSILESRLKDYFPKKEMSFHDKVVFAIDSATSNKIVKNNNLYMIKVKIYIKSEHALFEEEVFIDALLPHIPNKGDLIFLENEQESELELKAKSNLEIANKFAPKWFYCGSSNIQQWEVKDDNLKDLSFREAMFVHNVVYEPNSEIVKIVIGDGKYERE